MNLELRIDSISDGLRAEYQAALITDLEPFERLVNRIETDIARYREYRQAI